MQMRNGMLKKKKSPLFQKPVEWRISLDMISGLAPYGHAVYVNFCASAGGLLPYSGHKQDRTKIITQ